MTTYKDIQSEHADNDVTSVSGIKGYMPNAMDFFCLWLTTAVTCLCIIKTLSMHNKNKL